MESKIKQNQKEIAIINGTLGVGKTETSWAVMNRVQPAAVIDLDYLYAFKPKNYADVSQQAHVYQAAVFLIKHHSKMNINRFIINGVFETPAQLEHLLSYLTEVSEAVSAYRLVCQKDEVQRRIQGRNEPEVSEHLNRSIDLAQIQNNSALTGFIGKPVDTSNLSLEDAAKEIIGDMQRCGYWLDL